MVRSRRAVAGAFVALLALPFIGASPAHAAGGSVTVTPATSAPLHVGDTANIDVTLGDETGGYLVRLLDHLGRQIGNQIDMGTDVTAIHPEISWKILSNNPAAVGTGMKVQILPYYGATFAPIESATFDIVGVNRVEALNSPLQTGTVTPVSFFPGPDTGAYKVELWSATAKVATLATGSDVTTLGHEAFQTALKWTIPADKKALVGTGFKIKVVPGPSATFTAFESPTFDMQASKIEVWGAGSLVPNGNVTLRWNNVGETGDKVDVSLLKGKTATVLAKGVDNRGSADVKLPAALAIGNDYKFVVTPSNKNAVAGEYGPLSVRGPDAPEVTLGSSTSYPGDTVVVTTNASDQGPVQLDLVLKSAPTKSLGVLAKSAPRGADVPVVLPSKLALGDYSIVATVIGSKPVVTGSADLTIAAFPPIFMDVQTGRELAAGVTNGQTVHIHWTSSANVPVTVSLFNGSKETKLDAKEVTTNHNGYFDWVVDSSVKSGSTYTIVITNNLDPTVKYNQGSAFTVSPNPFVMAGS